MKKYLNATRISMLLALAIIGVFSVVNAGQIKSALFEQLTTITFDTAKQQLDIAETQIVENLYHRTTLLDINGLFMLAMNKRIIGNMEYYKDSNNVVHRLESTPPPIPNQSISLNNLLKAKNIPLVLVEPPTKLDITNIPAIPLYDRYDPQLFSKLTQDENIHGLKINERVSLSERAQFKTDVHVSTSFEFRIAELIASQLTSLGIENDEHIYDISRYDVKSYDFIGNTSRSVGRYYQGLDVFKEYIPQFETDLTLWSPGKALLKQGAYTKTMMNGYTNKPTDEFTYYITNYLQYPMPYYTIDNNLCGNGSRILYIMDSMNMRAITFLALGVKHITVIDTRQADSREYLMLALENNSYDAVVVGMSYNAMRTINVSPILESELPNNLIFSTGMWIDTINGEWQDGVQPAINASGHNTVTLSGWALDSNTNTPLTALFIRAGDKFIKCAYGLEHQGTAVTFGENLRYAGFDVAIPAKLLDNMDEIEFIQITSGGNAKYAPVRYNIF